MKILFFVRSYRNMAGGIEKKSLEIARGLTEKGHHVSVVSLDSSEDKAFFDWPNAVDWYKVGVGNPLLRASFRDRLKRFLYLRKLLKNNYDVAVGFQVGAFAMLRVAAIGLGTQTIAAERNAPTLFRFIQYGRMKKLFSNLILMSSTKVAILFPEFIQYYPNYLHRKIVVTPNWVQFSPVSRGAKSPNHIKQVLFVGRFSYQKNVECLIEAVSLMETEIKLRLIGTGDDLERIRRMSTSLGVDCEFIPPTRNLEDYYLEADLLCLPSRWEGFPNVVAEALATGLPVIGFRDCAGVPELIRRSEYGQLAEDFGSAQSLRDAIEDALKKVFVPSEVVDSVRDYTFDRFITSWENACREAARNRFPD